MTHKIFHKLTLFVLITIIISTLYVTVGCKEKERTEFIGFPQSFADLAEKVKPAVVNISTEKKQ